MPQSRPLRRIWRIWLFSVPLWGGVLAFSVSFSRSRVPACHPDGTARCHRSTCLQLLGSGRREGDERKPLDEPVTEKVEDALLDAWIRGIGQQWPLRQEPAAAPPPEPENPLAALLNLEALLSSTRNLPPETKRSIDTIVDSISTVLRDSSPQLSQWDQWISSRSEADAGASSVATLLSSKTGDATADTTPPSKNSRLIKQATLQLESILADASALVSPSNIQGLIAQASTLLELGSNVTKTGLSDLAKRISDERGLEVTREQLSEATTLAQNIVSVADALLLRPEAASNAAETLAGPETQVTAQAASAAQASVPPMSRARALFAEFDSAREVPAAVPSMAKAAEMGSLAGAIYEDGAIEMVHDLDQMIVAKGMAEDVRWMVTDSIAGSQDFRDTKLSETAAPILVRTITVRGFDASDEQVDRERLLMRICTAAPESVKSIKGVTFHSGLLDIARSIYADVRPYIDWMAPNHKLVLNGHSIGGALASLILVLLYLDEGIEFINDRVLRVYTFGSPPVMALSSKANYKKPRQTGGNVPDPTCEVLETIGLPSDIIYGFVQPWDPVIRLFSEIDALYPLIGDLGEDGVTPYANGPPRSLRPITKRIIEGWEGWPKFRETYRSTGSQQYRSAGVQHILLADPVRYVADRFIPVNIAVPPIAAFLRISSSELLPALKAVFPLDVFEISFVPQAIRSFVHHFYPAYGAPMMDHVARLQRAAFRSTTGQSGTEGDGDDDDEPCTVYVMQQDDGSSVVVDINKWNEMMN